MAARRGKTNRGIVKRSRSTEKPHGIDEAAADLVVVYDGDCPFCAAYVRRQRLGRAAGRVIFRNAREGGPETEYVKARGYDLNEGMAAILGGEVFHGADCMHRLALLSTPSDTFNRINFLLFRSLSFSRLIYPLLRAGRNMVLAVRGGRKL